MHLIRRARLLTLASLGLSAGLTLTTGCQTWGGGMTLPSAHYLEQHNPQYFPQEPDFPLTRELAYQEEAAGLLNPKDRAAPRGAAPVPGVAPAGPPAGAPVMPKQ
ncbi:MAG TPA: hypothetical protein VHR66_26730 [Gemmataceae bacterium]|jgi:hypothetical protein|nr:hypothetical protein [Gemmataceae bacterium]